MTSWYKMDPIAWNDGTTNLTLEQEAAYLRICHAIYITDLPVPNNPFVIAGLLRCNDRKAKRLISELVEAGKITVENGSISNRRAVETVSIRRRLSADRASAGSRGGIESGKSRAKVLKNNETDEALASSKSNQSRVEKNRVEHITPLPPLLYDRLIEAASSRGQCHPSLALGFAQISDLLEKGYDLEKDVLPIIRERAKPEISSWAYFVKIIISRKAERESIPAKAVPKPIEWDRWVTAFNQGGIWKDSLGPKPGEPGCLVPAEFLGDTQAEGAT